jgi:hypothetical protein
MDDDIPFAASMNTLVDSAGHAKGLLRARHGRGLALALVNRGDC